MREMLGLVPLSGAMYFAVFLGRDERAVMIARLVSSVANLMVPMTFSQFQSESEFRVVDATKNSKLCVGRFARV